MPRHPWACSGDPRFYRGGGSKTWMAGPIPAMTKGGGAMLELEHLSKTYADGTRALSDINLSVREGEIVSLIGGSGCGKTTLLRLIAGLDRTSAGVIRLDKEILSGPHPSVGIVF